MGGLERLIDIQVHQALSMQEFHRQNLIVGTGIVEIIHSGPFVEGLSSLSITA